MRILQPQPTRQIYFKLVNRNHTRNQQNFREVQDSKIIYKTRTKMLNLYKILSPSQNISTANSTNIRPLSATANIISKFNNAYLAR